LFSWKSKATREKEQREYEAWAFPHGPEQRAKLEALMRELKPKEHLSFMMMGFLTCKELYERFLEQTGSSESAVDFLINEEKQYKNVIRKREMTTCLALVLADTEIDERCDYPSAEEVNARIRELDGLRRKKKGLAAWI